MERIKEKSTLRKTKEMQKHGIKKTSSKNQIYHQQTHKPKVHKKDNTIYKN